MEHDVDIPIEVLGTVSLCCTFPGGDWVVLDGEERRTFESCDSAKEFFGSRIGGA